MTELEEQIRKLVTARSRAERPVEWPEIAGRSRPSRIPLLAGVGAALCAAAIVVFVTVGPLQGRNEKVAISPSTVRLPNTASACRAARLVVTGTRGERLHPDWLPAGYTLHEGDEENLDAIPALTYRPPGNDTPRVQLTRYHSSLPLSRLTSSVGPRHTITVQGKVALLSSGAGGFTAVAWNPTPGVALIVSGYKLADADLLAVANQVRYQAGTKFAYPTHPGIAVTRTSALAMLADSPTTAEHAVLSSVGEFDAVANQPYPDDSASMTVSTPVWVAWTTPRSASPDQRVTDVELIDASTGARVGQLALSPTNARSLATLTDRSTSKSCDPPFGVLTRAEFLANRPAAPGVTRHVILTTLGAFGATRTGGEAAQCALDTCDANVPVWLLLSHARDGRLDGDSLLPRPSVGGSWQAVPSDARTGHQDTYLSGVSGGIGSPPADLTALADLTTASP